MVLQAQALPGVIVDTWQINNSSRYLRESDRARDSDRNSAADAGKDGRQQNSGPKWKPGGLRKRGESSEGPSPGGASSDEGTTSERKPYSPAPFSVSEMLISEGDDAAAQEAGDGTSAMKSSVA